MDLKKESQKLTNNIHEEHFPMEENGNNPDLLLSDPTIEISNTLKEIDINSNGENIDDEPYTAPFEVLAEFLSALMSRDYKNAFVYCKLILQYEPGNTTVQEFYPLLQQKIQIEAAATKSSEESDEVSEESGTSEGSEASTEYYSSASVCSSASSEDEDTNKQII